MCKERTRLKDLLLVTCLQAGQAVAVGSDFSLQKKLELEFFKCKNA